MAEFVQSNLEDMLPELEQMARVNLFTSAETRSILKKRKAFEYKLRRKSKEKEDFLQYIQYEMNVLALIKKRRQKTGYTFKRLEIDVAIVNRIHRLFRTACFRFQEDVKLWLSHIEFSKSRGEKASVSKLFTRMLQVHNRKAEFWIAAAKWEMETNASMENARSILQRGLRFNPASQRLWVEYFRMELMNVDKLQKRREVLGMAHMDVDDPDVADVVVQGKVAEVVFRQAVEQIPGDVDFVLSFLPVVRLFAFSKSLEQAVFVHLHEHFGNHEKTWDASARRLLQGAPQDDTLTGLEDYETEQDESMFAVYEEAVEKVQTDLMWTLYLDACQERLTMETSETLTLKRLGRLLDVFNRAEEKNCLTEDMYLKWVSVLRMTGQTELVTRVLTEATSRYRKSASLWYQRLSHVIQMGDDGVAALAEQAFNSVPEKESLELYELMLEHYILTDPHRAETLLQVGVTRCPEVASPMKETYLDWSGVNGNLKSVRKVYKSLSTSQPLTVDFFRKYINLENSQPAPKMKRLRAGYEAALREFGTSEADLWLDYLRLELTHPAGTPEKAGQLHWRAVRALEGPESERFISHYNLLQTSQLV